MLSRNRLCVSPRRQLIRILVTAVGLAYASVAWAEPSDADRAMARQLGYQGVEAYQAKDYRTAEDKLGRAFEVAKVPTLGLWLARALTKNQRWVEAAEVYREVSRLEITEGKIEAQREAQRVAATELGGLEAKIPAVVITVEGAAPDQVTVQVDGAAVSSAVLGEARPMNPGQHRIVGKLGDQMVEKAVTLTEGQKQDVTLEFAPQQPNAAVEHRGTAPTADADESGGSDTMRLVGWGALGVGAAAIITGGVTGFLVLGKKSDLEDNDACHGTECEPPAHGDVDSYNQLRTISTVSFVVGGAAAALGATLLLTSNDNAEASPAVSAFIGVGHAGVKGSF